MALFPKAAFKVLVDDGLVVAGKRVDGVLEVTAPEAIPRAEHIDLVLRSVAWAGYGSGKSRSVVRRTMFTAPLHVVLPPDRVLPAGVHRYPFHIDVPPWLPPGLAGPDCGIVHEIEVRIDVDWAIDPVARLAPLVTLPPASGVRQPSTTRSPAGFHEKIVLEITLASVVVAQDEPVFGRIALRGGHDARFDAVDVALTSMLSIPMGRGDRRRGAGTAVRIPAEALRSGEAVPFELAANVVPPTYRTAFIDHDPVLVVSVDIPWAFDPSFEIPLQVLPLGSTLLGAAETAPVGGDRLRRNAILMAQATGLREGRAPVFVEGNVGPVALRVADAPSGGTLGLDAELAFPDVELGTSFRPLGMLEGFTEWPLLPEVLRARFRLESRPEGGRARLPDDALRAFYHAVLADLGNAAELRLSDHHLAVHVPLANDDTARMVDAARFLHAKAAQIGAAIAALPFPEGMTASRAAWEATAAEQSAVLVPSGPALHGLRLGARVLSGEERSIGASIRTVWTKAGPSTRIEVDLRSSPIPKGLAGPGRSERMEAVRALFPEIDVASNGATATLDRPGPTADPRTLLPAVQAFFDAVLELRGERRVDSPYR